MKPVVLRQQADRDIIRIVEHYLTSQAPEAAGGFIDALEKACALLGRQPHAGSLRYGMELAIPGLRSWPLKRYPYLLFYMERADHVDVWRVLHGELDLPSWLQVPDT